MADALTDRRILIVEDSPLVSDATADILRDFGCVVVGPAVNMALALELAEAEQIDAAVVDIHIRGGKAYSVLRILEARGIPFLLTSGYAGWSLPEEWQDSPRLAKPYSPEALGDRLRALLARAPSDGAA